MLKPSLSAAMSGAAGTANSSDLQQRISVTAEGRGSDIILIPGIACSRDIWRGLVSQLGKNHRFHLVQIAGFANEPAISDDGDSVIAPAAEAIVDYIHREQLKQPMIIGHSLGGEMALMIGARHPEQVGKLLVVDALPFYSLLFDPAATVASATPNAATYREALLAASQVQVAEMQRVAIERVIKTAAERAAVLAAVLLSDRKTLANATYELTTTDLRPELSHILAPVKVLYAWDSFYTTPAANIDNLWRQAYANLPNVDLQRIDNSFHFIMLDQPTLLMRALLAFIAE